MAFKGLLDKDQDFSLKVDPNFAKSFEIRKRREEIQKAKQKAKELELYSPSEKSSSESEDSSAELLTKKANTKFIKILSMIKSGNPQLKDPNFQAFSDSDFEASSVSSEKASKPVRYKELLTKNILSPMQEKKITPIEEQKQLKNDFLNAVDTWADKNNEDILVFRKPAENNKSKDLEDFVDTKAVDDIKTIKEYWSKPNDENDLFLKKFVLERLWKDEDELMTYNEIVDKEDEVQTNENEKFETAYNFRFEEEGFDKLKSMN